MDIGIYKGAAALSAYEKWQEVISQNIAAGSAPGFKKTDLAFSAMESDRAGLGGQSGFADQLRGVMPQTATKINFAPGELRHTGDDLDFAIQGGGFFQIQRANGEVGYTRDGEFHLSPDRTLVTKQGLPVMGESGPITFKPEAGPISINADGMIFQRDQQIAKLTVFDFKDPGALRRIGDGLFAPAGASTQPEAVERPQVLNGALEGSNVSPLSEMVNLIAVSRAYEATQRLIMAHDDNDEKAIQTLGNPTA
jgi:flagellar basal-body rod protein FlgF